MAAYGQPYGVTRSDREYRVRADRREAGFAAWYEFFPRSATSDPGRHGTFRDAERALPRIAALGFDVVYLPPIHPIGRTHRKGPNNALVAGPRDPGSPWAIGNEHGGHTAVNPDLGTLADFRRFVDAARSLGMEVALDYALQCSPDHPWVREHPEWFFIRPDGTIKYAENPPKKYEDIYPINFWCDRRQELWDACRDIFLFWIAQGVRTFRVDNPHTKPFAFWDWVIGEVQREHPDIVFLAEAFTRPKKMQALARLGFTQSYTYFTWRNTAAELTEYLTELAQPAMADFFRGNFFANTPDILHEYLQRGGRPAFRTRLLLAGTLSPLYGIYSGFELSENVPLREGSEEYLDSEKYQVRARDWGAPGNLDADIAALNRVRRTEPALQALTNLSFHPAGHPEVLLYLKTAWGRDLLCAVSLEPREMVTAELEVPLERLGLSPDEGYEVEDLLTGERLRWQGARQRVEFDPAARAGYIWRVIRGGGGTG
jgi:starch synthase (maltosyl-transferring)